MTANKGSSQFMTNAPLIETSDDTNQIAVPDVSIFHDYWILL